MRLRGCSARQGDRLTPLPRIGGLSGRRSGFASGAASRRPLQKPKSIWFVWLFLLCFGRPSTRPGDSCAAAAGGASSDVGVGCRTDGAAGECGVRRGLRGGGGGVGPERVRFHHVSSLSHHPTRPGETRTRRGNAPSRSIRHAVDRLMLAISRTCSQERRRSSLPPTSDISSSGDTFIPSSNICLYCSIIYEVLFLEPVCLIPACPSNERRIRVRLIVGPDNRADVAPRQAPRCEPP